MVAAFTCVGRQGKQPTPNTLIAARASDHPNVALITNLSFGGE